MKKFIMLIIAGSLITTSVHAQIKLMPKAGVTLANVALSDQIKDVWEGEFNSKVGFIVGIAAELPLAGDMVTLQPELLWHQKGFNYKYEETGYKEDYNYSLNYLEVPVLVKANFGNFYLGAGPSIAMGIIGTYNGDYTFQGSKESDSGMVKFGKMPANYQGDDEYVDNKWDFGIQVAAGAKISVVVVELRYGIGMTNLYDETEGISDNKSQNRSLQFTVGFPLGSRNRDDM